MRRLSGQQCMGRRWSVITTGDFNFGLVAVFAMKTLLDKGRHGTQRRPCPPPAARSPPLPAGAKRHAVMCLTIGLAWTNNASCRWRRGACRSVDWGFCQIKEEPARAGGGHSRRYVPRCLGHAHSHARKTAPAAPETASYWCPPWTNAKQ